MSLLDIPQGRYRRRSNDSDTLTVPLFRMHVYLGMSLFGHAIVFGLQLGILFLFLLQGLFGGGALLLFLLGGLFGRDLVSSLVSAGTHAPGKARGTQPKDLRQDQVGPAPAVGALVALTRPGQPNDVDQGQHDLDAESTQVQHDIGKIPPPTWQPFSSVLEQPVEVIWTQSSMPSTTAGVLLWT